MNIELNIKSNVFCTRSYAKPLYPDNLIQTGTVLWAGHEIKCVHYYYILICESAIFCYILRPTLRRVALVGTLEIGLERRVQHGWVGRREILVGLIWRGAIRGRGLRRGGARLEGTRLAGTRLPGTRFAVTHVGFINSSTRRRRLNLNILKPVIKTIPIKSIRLACLIQSKG